MRSTAGWVGAAALVLLTGCGDEARDAEQDARDVEQVKAVQTPPVFSHAFDPLSPKQVAFHHLEEPRCAFFDDEGTGPIAILKGDIGAMLVDGEVHRLAPDAGSAQGELGTRTKYDGRELSLRIDSSEDGATMTVRDGYDRSVYAKRGRLDCSG